MKKLLSAIVALTLLFTSCAPYKNTAKLAPVKDPVTTEDLIYSYSTDLIREPDNNLKKGWANRTNVQVFNIEIINISDKPIHGSQLNFYSDEKRLELVGNELAAEKLKTKKFPTAVYIVPIVLVGVIIYAAIYAAVDPNDDLDGDGFSDIDSGSSKKKVKDPMDSANLIQKGLYNFNIASVIFRPGQKVTGLVALHSKKEIDKLEIRVNDADFEIVK